MLSSILIGISAIVAWNIVRAFKNAPVLKEWEDIQMEDEIRRKAV